MNQSYLTTVLVGLVAFCASGTAQAATPNIVFVLCDDLGYGDVHCLNPERGKIPTPGVDRLAREGMIFTDAHSGSSVCTPTRYGLLTGRYSWRTRLQSGVVTGFAPCLIAPSRPTIASFLKCRDTTRGLSGNGTSTSSIRIQPPARRWRGPRERGNSLLSAARFLTDRSAGALIIFTAFIMHAT